MEQGDPSTFLETLAGELTSLRASFAVATFLTGYLSYRSLKPPTPPKLSSSDTRITDSIVTPHAFEMLAAYRLGLLGLSVWQALFILSPEWFTPSSFRHALPLDQELFVWNWWTGFMILVIDLCALVRLQAMGELGKNFTFELREPDKLCTTGLYRWMQHPSYSTGWVVFGLSASFFIRSDGVLGTLLPLFNSIGSGPQRIGHFILGHQKLVNNCIAGAIWVAVTAGGWRRVLDEEKMLKDKFGREWIEWNRKTARLIPFLF